MWCSSLGPALCGVGGHTVLSLGCFPFPPQTVCDICNIVIDSHRWSKIDFHSIFGRRSFDPGDSLVLVGSLGVGCPGLVLGLEGRFVNQNYFTIFLDICPFENLLEVPLQPLVGPNLGRVV